MGQVGQSIRTPLDLATARLPRGRVRVIPGRCKGCGYCVEFCPEGVLEESPAINAKGYHYVVAKADAGAACVNCGFCNLVCPEMAIYTEEMRDAREEGDGEYGTPQD